MSKYFLKNKVLLFILICIAFFFFECKHKKILKNKQHQSQIITDSLPEKCRLSYKSSKSLIEHVKKNEFVFDWVYAKANVFAIIDSTEENFDIKLKIKSDSAMLVSIQYLLGLEVAKILITKDSILFVNYIERTYLKCDFNYINKVLNSDIDFNLIQSVLFANSADFYTDDDAKLKSIVDKKNCNYLLSTERKRRLRKIRTGETELKNSLQILTLNPELFKIIKNEFFDPINDRVFVANYSEFSKKDSIYTPRLVNIDILATKKVSLKIDYVRIEKNTVQKLTLSIPSKYAAIQIKK